MGPPLHTRHTWRVCTLVSACCSLTPSDVAMKHGVFLEEGHHKAAFPEMRRSCQMYGTEVDKPELTCAVTVAGGW